MANGTDSESTAPGVTNRHAQRVIRAGVLRADTPHTMRSGDAPQTAYLLECEQCQHRYAANESDVAQHRCPKCQSGKSGIRVAPSELLRDR